jgi:hypothetical protein
MNRVLSRALLVLSAGLALGGCVVAPPVARAPLPPPILAPAPMYFYPERGQEAAQQERDRYECYRWAVGQSGFDPGMTPVSLPPPAPSVDAPRDGSAVAAGAVTGAVIGSVTSSRRHSGSAAVIGAIFGAALGAIAQESRAQAAEQANAAREQQNQAARQAALAPLDGFRRAMTACMQGRGYRVG